MCIHTVITGQPRASSQSRSSRRRQKGAMPAATKNRSQYHRPGYLRALGAYNGVKKSYEYCRGFIGVRTVAPIVEWVAEGTLSRLPVVRQLKAQAEEQDAAAAAAAGAAAAGKGYPTLHGIDLRLAALLDSIDDYVDAGLADPRSIQGRALRAMTHSVYAVAGWTPVVGGRIKQLMIEIDPEHMSLAPRLMDRPALEVRTSSGGDDDKGEDPDLMRASFDKEMDDVSVVTEASEEVAAAQQGARKKKKDKKRKDKRFLQNMGKGIKKVINYPKTPVHDILPDPAASSSSVAASETGSIAPEEGSSSSTAAVAPSPAPSEASLSLASSSASSTPLKATARKFFGGTPSRKEGKASGVVAGGASPST